MAGKEGGMEIRLGDTLELAFTYCLSSYSNQFTDPNPNVGNLCFVQFFCECRLFMRMDSFYRA